MKENKVFVSIIIATASIFVMGCSTESHTSGVPALFNTKVEAENAAKSFNCTGAHKMGDKWMPCKSHKSNELHDKNNEHDHDHNH